MQNEFLPLLVGANEEDGLEKLMPSLRGEEGLTETTLIGRGRVRGRGRERKRSYGREEGRGREGKCRHRLEASCGSFLPGRGECQTSEDGERESERKGRRSGWKGEGEARFGGLRRAVASPRSLEEDERERRSVEVGEEEERERRSRRGR